MIKNFFIIALLFYPVISFSQNDSEWEIKQMSTGDFPGCVSNYSYASSDIDNFLKVHLGGKTDLVLKLMDYFSDKCIRYVYIKAGTSHYIRNIPESVYYVKLAFGKDWAVKKYDRFCSAKFLNNQLFEEGSQRLDYYLIETGRGYQVPSYEIRLEVKSSNIKQEFNTSNISEEEFNR